MREFKFRIWDKTAGCYTRTVYEKYKDCYLFLGLLGDVVAFHDQSGDEIYFEEDRFVIQQFTGLKDKNGKDIYEGDVVEFLTANHGNKETGQVVFDEGEFMIQESCDPLLDALYYHSTEKNPVTLSVIGNCFENKELLNEH